MNNQTSAQTAALKAKLRNDFQGLFNTDVEFNASKAFPICSQGLRFRMERQRGSIISQFIPISKRGGLLRPAVLESNNKIGSKTIVINNLLTNKPFLSIVENPKTKLWDVINEEIGKQSIAGSVKISQAGDVRSITYMVGTAQMSKIDFKCPVQKTGMCSSHKPCNLLNVFVKSEFKSTQFEENPNGEPCKDDLEMNAYYPNGIETNELISLVAILEVMAHELH